MVFAAKTQDFAGRRTASLARGELVQPQSPSAGREDLGASARNRARTRAGRAFEATRARPPVCATAGALAAESCPLAKLKPLLVVRTPAPIPREFLRWVALYFAGFYLVALAWRVTRFQGDRSVSARRCTCSPAWGWP